MPVLEILFLLIGAVCVWSVFRQAREKNVLGVVMSILGAITGLGFGFLELMAKLS
ncbi:MAG: DUF2759 family protein [Calditerricola sp.]|jgi:Protein of unknown function (DUF2759).|nr:hypothetical protein [Bacillota bacterium]MCG0313819.1 DUF2759 family protein [Calditerricola sp.]